MKYTVFFDQINRTNFQVKAENEEEAFRKARKLYKRNLSVIMTSLGIQQIVREGWLIEADGEDKLRR